MKKIFYMCVKITHAKNPILTILDRLQIQSQRESQKKVRSEESSKDLKYVCHSASSFMLLVAMWPSTKRRML